MRGMLLVARRDLAAYLNNYWGYAVIAAVLLVDGLLFNAVAIGSTARYSSEVIEKFFWSSFGVTAVTSVLLTMRLVAEERQTGTLTLLDSCPLRPWQVIGGKYTAAMGVLLFMIASTIFMPALVMVNGKVSGGQLFAGYLGLALVAAACAAIGTFFSSISRSQLVAGFLTLVVVGVFVLAWLLAKISDPPLQDIFSYIGFYDRHFASFGKGQINTEDIVFFVSIAFGFLMLSTRFMAARRWK